MAYAPWELTPKYWDLCASVLPSPACAELTSPILFSAAALTLLVPLSVWMVYTLAVFGQRALPRPVQAQALRITFAVFQHCVNRSVWGHRQVHTSARSCSKPTILPSGRPSLRPKASLLPSLLAVSPSCSSCRALQPLLRPPLCLTTSGPSPSTRSVIRGVLHARQPVSESILEQWNSMM